MEQEINIYDLINEEQGFDERTLAQLEQMVKKYPYFQTARLLYVANLFFMHDKRFGEELRKASVFVPDRTALFIMIEGMHYDIGHAAEYADSILTEDDNDRTIKLIDDFLSTTVKHNDDRNAPSVVDLTTDYAAYLMQMGDGMDDKKKKEQQTSDAPKLKGGDLIDSFINETKGKQRFEFASLDDDGKEFESPEFSDEDEEIYTENMVNIYIKQGRYLQALEILRRICANNPKKNNNFASQIKLLEVIINGDKQEKKGR